MTYKTEQLYLIRNVNGCVSLYEIFRYLQYLHFEDRNENKINSLKL